MIDGIYCVASLDGSTIAREDCEALGLDPAEGSFSGHVIDVGMPQCAEQVQNGEYSLLFLGQLQDHAALADRLGLSRDESPAALALAALHRWGANTRNNLAGRWSFACWNAASRQLTFVTSANLRDRHYFALDGCKLAIAPSLKTLAKLPWVSDQIDPLGFATMMALGRLKVQLPAATFLKLVFPIDHNEFLTLSSEGCIAAERRLPNVAGWNGDFEEGVAAVRDRLRQIIRHEIAAHRHLGVFLSGGLDSTILAWLTSEELQPHQTLTAFCSVTPDGDEYADDFHLAKMAADHLGIPIVGVFPPREGNIYRAGRAHMERMQILSPRHYLYDAFYAAAQERGISLILDGLIGETSVTGSARLVTPGTLLRQAKMVAGKTVRDWFGNRDWAQEALFFTPSEKLREMLPEAFTGFRPQMTLPELNFSNRPIGLPRMMPAIGEIVTSTTVPGLRCAYPFIDPELIALTSGMPANFFYRDGMGRALARRILAGAVPDELRLAPKGGAFSPDYRKRLATDVQQEISRISALQHSGAGDLVDLEWLSVQLRGAQDAETGAFDLLRRLHFSTLTAEFVCWWQSGRSG